jgi:predicted ATPase
VLIRLKIDGFKNLQGVDLRFGPFTCIAGTNGVGKSNLFDAIQFLSALATGSLAEASRSVRDDHSAPYRGNEAKALFQRIGNNVREEMSFEAEMIVPPVATDEMGQEALASITVLRYKLRLKMRADEQEIRQRGPLEIIYESLEPIPRTSLKDHVFFRLSKVEWLDKVAVGKRANSVPFISTPEDGSLIRIHQDGNQGNPRNRQASLLTRTVLSSAEASEAPTAVCARQEMSFWRLLQLEPTALRCPDPLLAPARLGARGQGLPATLYRLAHGNALEAAEGEPEVYVRLASALRTFLPELRRVEVDRDDRNQTLSLLATLKDGSRLSARSLSDGTLRFLTLAVLERDPLAVGVICLEEPENGLHPDRIPLILRLLQDIAVDPKDMVSDSNPLRQVIVNTHSPLVVASVPEDSLLVIEPKVSEGWNGESCVRPRFSCLDGTWRRRTPHPMPGVSLAALSGYLTGLESPPLEPGGEEKVARVIDRNDVRKAFQLDLDLFPRAS